LYGFIRFFKVKKSFPGLCIYIHYLLGFPTETKEEVEHSLSFIKEGKINGGYIFPFSCKSGIQAKKIKLAIPKDEISRRLIYVKNP